MAKGNPRKPTAMKALQGTERPCRKNPFEPTPLSELPPPPVKLTREEKKAWKTLAGCVAPGVATNSDLPLFTMASKLFARMMEDTISDSQYATLLRCLSQLGMTPADRSRIVAIKTEEKGGRFSQFK